MSWVMSEPPFLRMWKQKCRSDARLLRSWSAPLFWLHRQPNPSFLNPKFKSLGIFCGCTAQFVSNRVGNPEYKISRDAAHVYGCVFRREALFCWMRLFLIRQKVVTVQKKKKTSWGNKFSAITCIRWYPTRSDTNRAVEPQKTARGWNFSFKK